MLTGIGVSLLAVGATAAAVKVHDFFEGETLLRDLVDEAVLSRTSLAELNRAWSRNARRSEAIVSLTSIPSRLPLIERTLKSLLRQSLAPRRIVLNLPRFSKREGVAYVVPAFLDGIEAVSIRWCEDWGPATKLLPSLVGEATDTPIIVVDDDRIYLTGHSMGGTGSADLAFHHPGLFAAVVPIAAARSIRWVAANAGHTPFWWIGGEKDQEIYKIGVAVGIDRMKRLGCPVQFTELPGEGHYGTARDFHRVLGWMGQHRRVAHPKSFTFEVDTALHPRA